MKSPFEHLNMVYELVCGKFSPLKDTKESVVILDITSAYADCLVSV